MFAKFSPLNEIYMIPLCFYLSQDFDIDDYCEICKRAFGVDEHARCGDEFNKSEPWNHAYWWFFIGPLIALVIFFVYARRVQVRNLLKKFTRDSDQEEQIPLTKKCENGRIVKKFRLFRLRIFNYQFFSISRLPRTNFQFSIVALLLFSGEKVSKS